jgi:hypothetical protein
LIFPVKKGEFFFATISSCVLEKEFYVVVDEEPLLLSEENKEIFWIPEVNVFYLCNSSKLHSNLFKRFPNCFCSILKLKDPCDANVFP